MPNLPYNDIPADVLSNELKQFNYQVVYCGVDNETGERLYTAVSANAPLEIQYYQSLLGFSLDIKTTAPGEYCYVRRLNYEYVSSVETSEEIIVVTSRLAEGYTQLFWANFDLYDTDGNLIVSKSDPIPVTPFDKPTFLSGMAMGLTGKGNPVSGAVGMYSYNGTMFPAVPVYDPSNPMEEGYTSECPYTVIANTPSGYYCYLTNYPLLHVDAPNSALAPSEIVAAHSFPYVDGEWQYKDSFMMAKGFTQLAVEPIWANYDILNEDESVYLAASDPVPDTFSKGYLVGAELRAKRVLVNE